jgi:hypothetical protein
MSDNALILHPRDALVVPPNIDALVAWFQDVGLAREVQLSEDDLPTAPRRWLRTGPAFEELVVFADADAERKRMVLDHVSTGPTPIDRAHFVRDVCCLCLVGPIDRPWFIASAMTEDPRCPRCGQDADWNRIANDWLATYMSEGSPTGWDAGCSACSGRSAPWSFDWRRGAAFARVFLQLWHLHAGEAAASTALLGGLEALTGTPWSSVDYHL